MHFLLIHYVLCNTVCRNRKNPVICFYRLGNLGACTLQAQHTKTWMHRQTVSWQRLMNWKKLVLIWKVTQDCIFICQGGEEVHSLHCNKLKSELNRNSAALLSNEIVKVKVIMGSFTFLGYWDKQTCLKLFRNISFEHLRLLTSGSDAL